MRTSGRMSRLEPLPGWARVIAAAVLVAAGLLVFAVVQDVVTEVEPVPTKLVDAGLAADGALSVTVSSCTQNPTATVTESPDMVTITAFAPPPGMNEDDCLAVVTVFIEQPLGDRRVVDGSKIGRASARERVCQ